MLLWMPREYSVYCAYISCRSRGLVAADFFHHEVGVHQAHTVLTQRFVGSAILEVIVGQKRYPRQLRW